MSVLTYRGFQGSIEADVDRGVLYGHVLHIQSKILYEGKTLAALRRDFETAIDDCMPDGTVEKQFRGVFNVRVKPHVHKRLTYMAAAQDLTLNTLVARYLEDALIKAEREARERGLI